jgi:hypothetical protein
MPSMLVKCDGFFCIPFASAADFVVQTAVKAK